MTVMAGTACSRPAAPESGPATAAPIVAGPVRATASVSAPAPAPEVTAFPSAERIVAIGDLHGDLAATRAVLRLAHAIDDKDRWVGAKLVLVQTGDEIDRGNDDRAILELFDRLADAASSAGGAVHALVGNHEVMNVTGDFRYVTPGGFAAFADTDPKRVPSAIAAQAPGPSLGRLAAFFPGGPFASRLAQRDAIAVVGDTLFVHGGVTLEHVRYGIARFNRELRKWMNGEGPSPVPASDQEGPLWTRRYSDDTSAIDCKGLEETLNALHLQRMVVGHTPHEKGISPACNEKVWRIDTGMSAFYGGPAQALEIRGDTVTVLRTGETH